MQGGSSPQIPVRRDIRALRPSERKRFFWCLKFLSILPPREAKNLRSFHVAWKVENDQRFYKTVTPRNIHDQFISSHQTCCEHGTPYFVYYHRHLMICVQIALNYADEVLQNGRSQMDSTLYNAHPREFDTVFARYQEIVSAYRQQYGITGALPQLSLHYWNPIDYTTNIEIPVELREGTPDQMDALYYSVNQHYAWNFNFATRWFSEFSSNQSSIPEQFLTMGFFQQTPARYTTTENQVVFKKLNPRDQPADRFFAAVSQNTFGQLQISDKTSDINLYKNYLKFQQTGNTIDVCTLEQQEMDTFFGSKARNLHWISQAERRTFSSSSFIKAYTYNKVLPHFQFAYSLFKDTNEFMKNYVSTLGQNAENSMQNSHNTMHNLLQLFMSDSQLSITNPIFFVFHSFIDYMLQVKIRMIRASAKNGTEYNSTMNFLDNNQKPNSVLDQVYNPTRRRITYGNYYIFEWAVPTTRFPQMNTVLRAGDYQAAFKGRNFILNEKAKGIRRSDQLQTFYQSDYLPNNRARYSYFKNFSNFSFDYNYELLDYDSNQSPFLTQMVGNNIAIHSYIQAIASDYAGDWNLNKTVSVGSNGLFGRNLLRSAREGSSARRSSLVVERNSVIERSKKQIMEEKHYLKALRLSINAFATYPSIIKSTLSPVIIKLTPQGEKVLKQITASQRDILKEGVTIAIASIFTRGAGSLICPNCKSEKELWIHGSDCIAEMDEELYCAISKGLTFRKIFQIRDNKTVEITPPKIKEIFDIYTPRPLFNKLELIDGANEVEFNVIFKGIEHNEASEIQISLYSYSIQNGELADILTKKKDDLNVKMQFPRVTGVSESVDRVFKYAFRKVKVQIKNFTEYREFTFDITTLHNLVTYEILIEQKQGKEGESYLDVLVTDKDYDFKMSHYNTEFIE